MEHELWFTALLNDYLAGVANAILALFRVHAHNPARPWQNFMAMQILVALILIALFAVLRRRLSVEQPGKMQHTFEVLYDFLSDQGDEIVGHQANRYLAFFGTLFFFILFCNLIGIIPGFESPTMFMPAPVPAGCAMATLLYYNIQGARAQGLGRYLLHFAGPVWWLAPLMIPIEIISHLARPLSLTIRLFANMYAGEQVTIVFLGLVPVAIPAIFMGLHVFVSFLQAYIFTLLTMVYVGGAVATEH
ncbi:MAG: F0F1 ATP synthase subunit A [Acidobacteria bacterium]|nr:F0F1 ATP synthase subunit A [Acidobacteriota bacterium]